MSDEREAKRTGSRTINDASPATGQARKLAHVNGADQLIYLADVIAEFKAMADDLGAQTLSDILGVGQAEALRAADRLRASR
jgi:hypothetical protein